MYEAALAIQFVFKDTKLNFTVIVLKLKGIRSI